MEPDRYHELGTIFREGDSVDTLGASVRVAVNKAMAEHKRLLESPLKASKWAPDGFVKQDFPGRRETVLKDGTRIVTTVSPYGLVPMLIAQVYTPELEILIEGVYLAIGFYHIGSGPDAYLYETEYLLARLPQLAPLLDEEAKMLAKPPIDPIDTACYYKPDEYSGLMRLWAQSKRAANLAIPGADFHRDTGLVRNSAGNYWFIKRDRTAGTLTAFEAMLDPSYGTTLDDYKARSESTDFSQFERQLAEAQYLVGMIVNPLDAGMVLLTDTTLVQTLAENLSEPTGRQWMSWTFQRRDQSDEAAPAVRWLYNESSYWHPWPRFSQPNPVYMQTCRVDFTFPTATTIAAALTVEATDEMSWLWEDWFGSLPVGSWEWPVQTWYDVTGAVQEIRAWQDTNASLESTGLCLGATWPPPLIDTSTAPDCTIQWTETGTCVTEQMGVSYGYHFLGIDVTCYESVSTTTDILAPPQFELLNCVTAGQRYDAPRQNYTEEEYIGGNVLWRQLRSDAAFFIQRTRRQRYFHYETRYFGATDDWDAYGNAAWYHPTYISVAPSETITVDTAAGGWVVANDTVYELTAEQATDYEAILDSVGPAESDYYTSEGWLHWDMLYNTVVIDPAHDMEWIRISYDGQKIIMDDVWNPISLSTYEIVTHPQLVDCFEKSIWIGGA